MSTASPLPLEQRILLRDANLIILDKPAGLAVHGGPSHAASVEDALPALKFGLRHVPVPAHRLDRDTSGCLILARHPKARTRLGRLFEARLIGKTYWALVEGQPPEAAGSITLRVAKQTDRQGWRMVVDPVRGQDAVTRWQVCGRGDRFAWLSLQPLTGRTHQLRVHLAAMGWPIAGDTAYGSDRTELPLCLHARSVAVPYWAERPPVTAVAPLPPLLHPGFAACGWGVEPESEI
jgi:RluA family pseudouridine synthase